MSGPLLLLLLLRDRHMDTSVPNWPWKMPAIVDLTRLPDIDD
jgi:hypothetical protein